MLAPPIELAIERLRRLPQRSSDVFELALIRLPSWITGEPGGPYRPVMYLARSREVGVVGASEPSRPAQVGQLDPWQALAGVGCHDRVGHRPGTIAVREPALGEALREHCDALGIPVRVEESLPLVDEVKADMERSLAGVRRVPGYLDGAGVTIDGVRAFADAAVQFHGAALWCHLADYDLVRIESPRMPGALSCFVVMGGGGQEFGLGFFSSPTAHEAFSDARGPEDPVFERSHWALTFDELHEMPVADGDLWLDHSLPVAAPHAHPFFCGLRRGRVPERADASRLAIVEGLLRALATTTEDELDRGRWSKRVHTFAGEVEYTLALPDVLEPRPLQGAMPDRRIMERTFADLQREIDRLHLEGSDAVNAHLASIGGRVPHVPGEGPRAEADEKYHAALGAHGRHRQKLAREAIALWPDHADAWILRAEDMPDLRRARELWQHALDAAARELGPERMRDVVGHFWIELPTRPYMRALAGLARIEWLLDERKAALEHWREMLRLNPSDNQGIRHVLVPRLLAEGLDEEATRVLEMFPEDPSAMGEFAKALLAFRHEGPGPAAAGALQRAHRANRHVLKYLVGNADSTAVPRDGYYSPGDEREAAMVADELAAAIENSAGARVWLREFRREGKKTRKRGRRPR